jgi:hypothetical protein
MITQLNASVLDKNGVIVRELCKKEAKDMSLFSDNIFFSEAF